MICKLPPYRYCYFVFILFLFYFFCFVLFCFSLFCFVLSCFVSLNWLILFYSTLSCHDLVTPYTALIDWLDWFHFTSLHLFVFFSSFFSFFLSFFLLFLGYRIEDIWLHHTPLSFQHNYDIKWDHRCWSVEETFTFIILSEIQGRVIFNFI